ncbi:hypothetical protein E3P91_02974 [Wallemia ichthyophaga]|nr:hypothetical protein E3P91_02974 [Wallemia ichthyophaga]TIB62655.1 hypothetical protein E3P78_02322 [Wallemia ichthyophaga]
MDKLDSDKNLNLLLGNKEYLGLFNQYLQGAINLYQLHSFCENWPETLTTEHSHNNLILSILHNASLNKQPIHHIPPPQLHLGFESEAVRSLSGPERQRIKKLVGSGGDHAEALPSLPLYSNFSLSSETKLLPSPDNLASRLNAVSASHSLSGVDPECIPYLQSSLALYLKNILQDSLDNSQSRSLSLSDVHYTLSSHPHPESTATLHKHLNSGLFFDSEHPEHPEHPIDPSLFVETIGSPSPPSNKSRPDPYPLKRPSIPDSSFSFPNKRSRKPKAVVLSSDDDEDADGDPDADFRAQW